MFVINQYLKGGIMNEIVDYIVKKFDGEIMEDNKWRIDGSTGKKYTVEWDPYHKNYSCNCLGYTYSRKCKHTHFISESFRTKLRGRAGARVV